MYWWAEVYPDKMDGTHHMMQNTVHFFGVNIHPSINYYSYHFKKYMLMSSTSLTTITVGNYTLKLRHCNLYLDMHLSSTIFQFSIRDSPNSDLKEIKITQTEKDLVPCFVIHTNKDDLSCGIIKERNPSIASRLPHVY